MEQDEKVLQSKEEEDGNLAFPYIFEKTWQSTWDVLDENKSEIFDKAIYKLLTDQIKLHASFQPCHFDPNLITQ